MDNCPVQIYLQHLAHFVPQCVLFNIERASRSYYCKPATAWVGEVYRSVLSMPSADLKPPRTIHVAYRCQSCWLFLSFLWLSFFLLRLKIGVVGELYAVLKSIM